MTKPDELETIARHVRVEIPKVKGSRFIGDAFPVQTEEDTKTCRAKVMSDFPDASHHCYAFSVHADRLERSSDAGEPGGTAGAPILRRIHSSGLTNVLVAVTRYFGGTKLGRGGLIRAYGRAAESVLEASCRVTRTIDVILRITFDYNDTSAAMWTLERFTTRILSAGYEGRTSLEVALLASRLDDFERALADALSGRGSVEEVENPASH